MDGAKFFDFIVEWALPRHDLAPSTRTIEGELVTWFLRQFRWILLVSGLLTTSMIYVAIAPRAALLSMFGETLEGPVADVIVRTWGALIALVGAMLIYSAFKPAARPLVLTVAGASKLLFIGLVLGQGDRFLAHQAGLAVVVDSVMIVLYAAYLLARPRP